MKVVYMMADTFRRDHLGAYGNDWIHTPNLDKLASESALFENAYIGSFPTVPNRRDTLLGRGDIGLPFNRWKTIERQEVTLPERLSQKKITSMLITDTQNNVTRGINMYKGYTAWYLNRGQEGDPHWLDANVPLEWPVPHELIRYRAEMWHQVLINRAHRKVETDWFAPGTYSKAIEWLEHNYQREDFFLWIDTFDPHEPWDPPQYYVDMYDPGYEGRIFDAPTYGLRKKMGITDEEMKHIRACYAGEVTMVDTWIGRLLNTVEKLGIWDETMIIFTSDHGTMFDTPGDNGLICKPNTVGADGMLMSAGRPMKEPVQYFPIFQNVARIPLIIHLPGMKDGKQVKSIVQPWDMNVTLLDIFGIEKPDELIGQSLLPLIKKDKQSGREVAICGTNTLAQAINNKWIYTVWRGQRKPSLINLESDPLAETNIIKENTETAKWLHGEIVDFMGQQDIDSDFIESFTH
ncbi:sulfatase-like hydrolase/transferase [Candidatus Poribacteria bacterium]|nr:sulfatase-like hydrolase/transferase [Candidatus Poribacteria bacterium]